MAMLSGGDADHPTHLRERVDGSLSAELAIDTDEDATPHVGQPRPAALPRPRRKAAFPRVFALAAVMQP
jgi:hypothetical protein